MTAIHELIIFSSALLANLILTPLAIRVAHKYGILDHPGHRKIHDTPIPRLGGVTLLFSTLVGVGAALALSPGAGFLTDPEAYKLATILAVTFLAALLGFMDDLYNMRPRLKFLFQAALAGIFAAFAFKFECLHVPGFPPLSLGLLGVPLTMFWIMAVLNGFNFMDGLDGLAGSVTAGCLLALGAGAAIFSDPALVILCLSALAPVLVFLCFNWRPARIYMGDTGSNALGMLVACSLVALGQGRGPGLPLHPEPYRFQLLLCTLLAAYPALEVTLSVARRGVKKYFYGRSMQWSEKEHIHHRLIKLGYSAPGICGMALFFNFALAGAALLILGNQKADGVWIILPVVVGLGFLTRKMGFFDFLNPKKILHEKPHYLVAHHFIKMQLSKLQLAQNLEEVLTLVNQACLEFGIMKYAFRIPPRAADKEGQIFSRESPFQGHQKLLSDLRRGLPIPGQAPFRDRVVLESDKGDSSWVFEPLKEETDLDVEYRVLAHEFMQEALRRVLAFAHLPFPHLSLEKSKTHREEAAAVLRLRPMARKSSRPLSLSAPLEPTLKGGGLD
jgi:UDP-GlcNAc:undecaprenyl-phosphate GlcNAc-1-phosphate transferase